MMCVFINNHQQKETLGHRSENAHDEEAKVREMLDNLNWRLCYLNGIDEHMTPNAVFYGDGIWVCWVLVN